MNDMHGSGGGGAGVLREIEERMRARLAAVERQNEQLHKRTRLLTLGIAGVTAVLALVALSPDTLAVMGLRQDETLMEAHGFRLLDRNGIRRGEWSVDDAGWAQVSLMDQQGRERLNLTVRPDGSPGIALINSAGQRRVVMAVGTDETATLVFADKKGAVPRAILGLTSSDASNLAFIDAAGTPRLGLSLDASGMGTVMLPDSAGESGAEAPGGGGS